MSIEYVMNGGAMILSKDDKDGVYCGHCQTNVKKTIVFSFDSSNGEYGCVSICEDYLFKAKKYFVEDTSTSS